jgi:hypothetical protein
MTESPPQPKRRTGLLIWMIVSQLLMVGSLVFWFFGALFSIMAFDSGNTPEAWRFVILVWSYPIIPLILVIAAWIAFWKRKNILAAILSGLSFTPPLLLVAVMWIQTQIWKLTR